MSAIEGYQKRKEEKQRNYKQNKIRKNDTQELEQSDWTKLKVMQIEEDKRN
jgi:hypothetical protein